MYALIVVAFFINGAVASDVLGLYPSVQACMEDRKQVLQVEVPDTIAAKAIECLEMK